MEKKYNCELCDEPATQRWSGEKHHYCTECWDFNFAALLEYPQNYTWGDKLICCALADIIRRLKKLEARDGE